MNQQIEDSDINIVLDNTAVYNICKRNLEIERPLYTHLNRIIAQFVSSMTTSMRFLGTSNTDLADLKANLVPFPKAHFLLPSYAPFIPIGETCPEQRTSAAVKGCFKQQNSMATCDLNEGKYISCELFLRGDIVQKEVNRTLSSLKSNKTVQFVDWSNSGMKAVISNQPIVLAAGGDQADVTRSCGMLGNNTSVTDPF
jgi:tubulin alpha